MARPEDSHAWDIYSKQLFPQGFGYPLWHPSPENDGRGLREVDIGAVGYLDDGRFRHIFNAMKEANDPFNRGNVPSGFKKFSPKNLNISENEAAITQDTLTSRSVHNRSISADAGVTSPTSIVTAGGSFSFEVKDDTGACLILQPPGWSKRIASRRHIVNYMREYFDSWVEFATGGGLDGDGPGLDLKPQDIMFVSGTTKTTRWVCSAFTGGCRDMTGSINCNVVNAANFNVSLSVTRQQAQGVLFNHGPTVVPAASSVPLITDGSSTRREVGGDAATRPHDATQSVFLHYFKMKRRIFWKQFINAAAGPHELPPNGPDSRANDPVAAVDSGSFDEVEFEEYPLTSQPYDPVDYLLNYILAHSDAEIAIATDRDLFEIFSSTGIPDDIAAGLDSVAPTVDVDEHGVGTISVDLRLPGQPTATTAIEENPIADSTAASDGAAHEIVRDDNGPATTSDSHQAAAVPGTEQVPQTEPGEEGAHGTGDEDESERRQPAWEPAANGHIGSVTSLAVSPDSKWVASGSDDTAIILWETADQSFVRKWEGHGDIVWHLAFSPDSQRLASSGGEGHIMIWEVEQDHHLATLEGHTETIHSVVWSPDGKKLASGSDDMTVRVWDTETYEQLHLLEGHSAMVTFVLFSHDGRWLASGGADYVCRIWDVTTGTLHKELRGHTGMVWTASFDLESRRIATSSDDGTVRIWNAESGEELVILREHHGPVWSVQFSEDGKQLLSASSDSTVKVCDSYSGDLKLSLEGHDSMVNVAAFSPDGEYIVSASADNTVRLWKRSDGSSVKTFNEHNDKVTHALFTPDGLTLSSGSDDGTIRVRLLSDFVRD